MNRSPITRLLAPLLLLLLAACAGQGPMRDATDTGAAVQGQAGQTHASSTALGAQAIDAETDSAAERGRQARIADCIAAVEATIPELPENATPAQMASQSADAAAAVEACKQNPPAPAVDSGKPAADPAAIPHDASNDPSQAERDYAAIYGDPNAPYDPVADATLPPPAQLPTSYDPWEPFNRRMHAINNRLDRHIATPLANFYIAVAPRPVRLGVTNFFNNLGQPVSALNALLQGRPKQASQSLARFAVNSTIGLAGFFDPATRFNIPNRSEDFGQTLGRWGWKRSRYLELPLLGPRTVRDMVGMAGDSPLSPYPHIENDKVRVFTQGLQLVDIRTQLKAVDSMREGAVDEYALFRDAWMQRRQYQIFEDGSGDAESDLPDYLKDDSELPLVPVDAVPVLQP